jgi:hypothetical protein
MKRFSEQYDAYYDDKTNEWLESKCDDPECEYCTNRPEKPLPEADVYCSTCSSLRGSSCGACGCGVPI